MLGLWLRQSVILSVADRERLRGIADDRTQLRKHVERARIVLASAERKPAQRVAVHADVSRPTVWRWQQRYAEAGVGEACCATRPASPAKPPIAAEITARVVALTCTAPPHQATHWTGRAVAKATGVSLRSVQRIWQAYQLQPHRIGTIKHSRDPSFATKLTDIVGLYVDPPATRVSIFPKTGSDRYRPHCERLHFGNRCLKR